MDSTPPQAPANLRGQPTSYNASEIAWHESIESDGWVDHYNVYRDGQKIASLGGKYPERFLKDSGLIGSSNFVYQVSAVNGSGVESPLSSPLNITTPGDSTAPLLFSAWVDI